MTPSQWDELGQKQRERREKLFEVEVLGTDVGMFSDEKSVHFTQNGHQWTAFSLLPDEARKMIEVLETFAAR